MMWLLQLFAGHQRNSVIFTSRVDFQFHNSSTCQRDRLHFTSTHLSLTAKQPCIHVARNAKVKCVFAQSFSNLLSSALMQPLRHSIETSSTVHTVNSIIPHSYSIIAEHNVKYVEPVHALAC